MSVHGIKMFAKLVRTNVYNHNLRHLRCFSNYNKDLVKQPITSSVTTPDYLLQNLKNATSPQTVLELVGSHHKIMNSKQLIQALRSLFTLQKYGNSSLSMQQIIRHPDFDKLCYKLKTQAGMIELNETIEALKVISYVGVSSDSTIVQVLLQLLRHSVNDLSLQQLMFLDFILRQFKSSPLVDGLLIALPIVFEVNLPIKMDKEDPTHLAEYLQYAAKKTVSDKCIELIVNALSKYIDGGGVLDGRVAKSILWSICDMDEDEFFEPLIKKAINSLLIDIDKLEYRDIQTTLTKLLYKYSLKYPFYYDEIFVDTCANYIVDKDMGIDEAIYSLRRFARASHSSESLLNYISKKCQEDPESFFQLPALQTYIIATAMALSEFKPVHWDVLKEVLLTTDCFKNYNKGDLIWLKLAASLCALDIYKIDVLEKAAEKSVIERAFHKNFTSDFESLVLINQAICVLQPDYTNFLPPDSVIKKGIAKIKPVLDYPLESALQTALGGENYVNTCVKTELGHHIDHVILMRKGGYPVPLSKTAQYIEEIQVPLDGNMILILALGPLHYALNTKKIKATSALTIKTLEAKGYIVIPVCMEMWNSLADFERIPYIMQTIRLKTENQMQMSDTVY